VLTPGPAVCIHKIDQYVLLLFRFFGHIFSSRRSPGRLVRRVRSLSNFKRRSFFVVFEFCF
jgi:hypothetical protein